MRKLCHPHRKAIDPVRDVMRGRLPLQRGIHRQDHFVDAPGLNPPDQRIDRQIFRADAFQRGQSPAKDMEATGEQPRAIKRPKIGNFLDHAQCARVTARIDANLARVGCIDIAARRAGRESQVDSGQRRQQWTQHGFALLEQMQDGTPRRARAKAGEPGQRLGERVNLGRSHEGTDRGLRTPLPSGERGQMRIVFMGTPDFAVPILRALVDHGHDVVAAYCQPARRAGRGKALSPSPVELCAQALHIPVRTPVSLRDAAVQAEFAALKADVGVVAAYGLILPRAVLDLPRHGCLNVHGSLLPRWRGAAPVQRAILAGDAETGVDIMQMESGLDTGPILLEERTSVAGKTAGDLTAELSMIGARLMLTVLADLAGLPAAKQAEDGVSYASKIDKAEAQLDFTLAASAVERQVRAFNPAPGAYFVFGGERIRVLSALVEGGAGSPGTVIDDRLGIATGEGVIRPVTLQRAGRGVMTSAELLRGFAIPAGSQLT